MSESVPVFRTGDKVRVMQTDEMVARGLANQRGFIIATWSEPDRGIGSRVQMCRVQLGDRAETIGAHSLMGVFTP